MTIQLSIVASILISAFMLIMSYRQLVASEKQLAASEKKELATTEALEQAKEARRLATEIVNELDDARRKLLDLAKISGTTMLTELMASNFWRGPTLQVQLSLCDRIVENLRQMGLSEADIAGAKELWSKGIGVIYHGAIVCALEGRTVPYEINTKASPELRRASDELAEMMSLPEWQVPSPDEMQSFIEKKGFMNKEVGELIDDYRYFLKTGDIRRREMFEALRDKE